MVQGLLMKLPALFLPVADHSLCALNKAPIYRLTGGGGMDCVGCPHPPPLLMELNEGMPGAQTTPSPACRKTFLSDATHNSM